MILFEALVLSSTLGELKYKDLYKRCPDSLQSLDGWLKGSASVYFRLVSSHITTAKESWLWTGQLCLNHDGGIKCFHFVRKTLVPTQFSDHLISKEQLNWIAAY